ncbi:MAG: nucleotide exchange factor GrpE [Desulfobulbaceae bacterium]|nr:nucleotide exchange factor GrpE [Desulfobulbaceae bacterium]
MAENEDQVEEQEVAEAGVEDLESSVVEEEILPEVDELAQLTVERDELMDKYLRLAAEFENYKKRMARDRVTALQYAEERLIKELLPAIDNLERAVGQGEKDDPESDLLAGVKLTLKGLAGALGKFEVKSSSCLGETFDPNLHEALAMDFSTDFAENQVMVEFEKGYQYKDKLIRPAKVVVSKGEAA